MNKQCHCVLSFECRLLCSQFFRKPLRLAKKKESDHQLELDFPRESRRKDQVPLDAADRNASVTILGISRGGFRKEFITFEKSKKCSLHSILDPNS